jgi:hypothetical protein
LLGLWFVIRFLLLEVKEIVLRTQTRLLLWWRGNLLNGVCPKNFFGASANERSTNSRNHANQRARYKLQWRDGFSCLVEVE